MKCPVCGCNMRFWDWECPNCKSKDIKAIRLLPPQSSLPNTTIVSPAKNQPMSVPTRIRAFDLNIEEVLENWEVEHAVREVIANALDEQVISNTDEIHIVKDNEGNWHIRDFGRGLQIEHFTLNENMEKLNAPTDVIGKFGVGLKDALATFYRRGIDVHIRSKYGLFLLKQERKHGFSNIKTLHVAYDDTPINMHGTDFSLHGLNDSQMALAKSFFLKFSNEEIIESNNFGQILRRKENAARIYIMGVFASEEPNFLFSYNITSLTDSMKKKLNRERLNIGRTTYADRVKSILKNSTHKIVEDQLICQVTERATGRQCDEMSWIEISQLALNLMHNRYNVAYLTENEIQSHPDIIDNARSDGYQVVVIDEHQKAKLQNQVETGGPQVRTLESYIDEYNTSFEYTFINYQKLTYEERRIHDYTPVILSLIGLTKRSIPPIQISETIRVTTDNTGGVWDESIPAIVIKRNKLASLAGYASTLLHEVGHAKTGASDITREFEMVLTDYLGRVSVSAITK